MSTTASDQSQHDVSELDLSGQQLLELSEHLFADKSHVVKLKLKENKLKRLPANVFDGLKSLRYLNLKKNRLVDGDEAIVVLRKLRTLNLSFNRIRKLEQRNFSLLTALRVLHLTGNTLGHVSLHSFCSLRNLTKLSLNETNIGQLNAPLFDENGALTHLSIAGANLRIGTGLFRRFENLIFLDLSNNQFVELEPDTFHALVNLRTLNLANNCLRLLTENLLERNLNLEHLDLSLNKIDVIEPDFFRRLANLETLLLHGNSNMLQMTNDEFAVNDRLIELSFSECLHFANQHLFNLKKLCYDSAFVPQCFRHLLIAYLELANFDLCDLQLKSTIVDGDHFEVIGRKFRNLETLSILKSSLTLRQDALLGELNRLRKLDLSECSLESLDLTLFADQNDLRELILSKCSLRVIAARAFQNLRKLEKLDLSRNFFVYPFDVNVFYGLVSLLELDLRSCYIRQLPKDLFVRSKALEVVRLSKNCILDLDLRIFRHCTSLRQLYCWKYTNLQHDVAHTDIIVLE